MTFEQVLCLDLGGTKIASALCDRDGQLCERKKFQTDCSKGPKGLLDQILDLCKGYLGQFSGIQAISLASAGPLIPGKGDLLDPTNFMTEGKSWGVVPLGDWLRSELPCPVYVENDAAAAVLAEYWLGGAKGVKDCMALTLGTGLGVGVIVQGQLVRAGRGLHPEGGHIPLSFGDDSAPSGSGFMGSAEAYLSGRNFTARMARQWGQENLTGEELTQRARDGEKKALGAFEEYSIWLSAALNAYVVLYAPQVIVISGGFSRASDLFLPKAEERLVELLQRRRLGVDLKPTIKVSQIAEDMGLLGAAHVAFSRQCP